jgi:tyrosine-specific transport protein
MMDFGKVTKGALLIAGTSIGGGMLALPVESALGGFIPSVFIYLICWALMASTGLLFLEVSLWIEGESNIISMAQKTLGWGGQLVAWLLYLFLFYSLTMAVVGIMAVDITEAVITVEGTMAAGIMGMVTEGMEDMAATMEDMA